MEYFISFYCNVIHISRTRLYYTEKSWFTIDRKLVATTRCFFFFPRGKKREIRISGNKLREREPEYRVMEYGCVNRSRYEWNTRRIICLPYRVTV